MMLLSAFKTSPPSWEEGKLMQHLLISALGQYRVAQLTRIVSVWFICYAEFQTCASNTVNCPMCCGNTVEIFLSSTRKKPNI